MNRSAWPLARTTACWVPPRSLPPILFFHLTYPPQHMSTTTTQAPLGSPAIGLPPTGTVTLKINGVERQLDIAPWTTLLDALREYLDLTGTKKGCDHGQCGACTVLADGVRINSCLTLAVMKDGGEITTVEGLAQGEVLHPLQQAFIDHDAFQCG